MLDCFGPEIILVHTKLTSCCQYYSNTKIACLGKHYHSSYELLHVILSETAFLIPSLGLFQLREDIVETRDRATLRINVNQRPGNVEKGNHLVAIVVDDQRVRLTRRLEHVRACRRVPVVLLVPPHSLERVRVDRTRMTVTAERAAAGEAEQVNVIALGGAQTKRSERQAIGLRDPDAWVFVRGADRRYYYVGECLDGRGREGSCPMGGDRSRRN